MDEIEKLEESVDPLSTEECGISLKQITVKWPSALLQSKENTLTDVSFTVRTDQVFAIIGPVGSGKVYTELSLCFRKTSTFDFDYRIELTVTRIAW